MNKGGLVAEISRRTGMSKADIAAVVDTAMDVIRERVVRGERVALVGFGTFEKVRRNKRIARNPRKPEISIVVPARDVPSFAAGKQFKDMMAAKKRKAKPKARSRR
ncbi:MAG: HU family DNA-binding protein [Actinomycetota bacterium]